MKLKGHKRFVHDTISLECLQCKKVFKPTNLKQHQKVHMASGKECSICFKNIVSNLKRHEISCRKQYIKPLVNKKFLKVRQVLGTCKVSSFSSVSGVSSVSSVSRVSSLPSTYVDPWDIMNNFCFHVYTQKWHM